jgi:hypothetical protein
MRMIILAAMAAAGISLVANVPMLAAPINGGAIDKAAATTSPVTKVPCAWRRVCGRYGCARRRVCW